jgi:hypothetical protein
MEWNAIKKLLVCADDINTLGESKNTMKKNRQAWSKVRKVKTKKCQYMVMSSQRNIKTVNKSNANIAKFKYLGTTIASQNCIHDEIKSRLTSENACYHSFQSLLSSILLSKT